jgi:carboxyl-terminal processing protease
MKTLRARRILAVALLLAVLGVGLVAGILLDRQVLTRFVPPDTIPADARADFQLMAEAWNTIQRLYVDQSAAQPRTMTYGAIGGMVDALGDTGHSRFLTPAMLQEQHSFTQGEYEGIGAQVEMKGGHAVIVAPFDGSPAQQAGLRPGDVILSVDGTQVAGMSLDEIIRQIVGPAGTSVTLSILNPSTGQTRSVSLTRARIALHNVTWHQLPGTRVAHVRVAAFSDGVTDDLRKAVHDIQNQELTGLILDLRDDPGGLLDEAVGTASLFLASGNVLLEKDAQGHTTPVPVRSGDAEINLPMVVLINAGTASASEIVAGALQDAGRAQLVGEKTFGTGTVLSEIGLSDGSALLLAVEEWLTPDGRLIWHQGIPPDVVVTLPQDGRPLFPTEEEGLSSDALRSADDAQLLRALALLTGSDNQVPQ